MEVVNQAIGQGEVQVTPLQVARFIAAIGNGGTLYRPQLVEKVEPVDGDPPPWFSSPKHTARCPSSPSAWIVIQEAMISVVKNPRGTANFRLRGLSHPGGGQNRHGRIGHRNASCLVRGLYHGRRFTGLPDIAIAVILENQGEGSDWAAPVFQRPSWKPITTALRNPSYGMRDTSWRSTPIHPLPLAAFPPKRRSRRNKSMHA